MKASPTSMRTGEKQDHQAQLDPPQHGKINIKTNEGFIVIHFSKRTLDGFNERFNIPKVTARN